MSFMYNKIICGTRSQRISQFYLYTPCLSANGMNYTCLCLHSHQTFITIPYPLSSDKNPLDFSDAVLNTMGSYGNHTGFLLAIANVFQREAV